MPTLEELIPIVPTGITWAAFVSWRVKNPFPSWKLLHKGIPITGIAVRETIIPGRCAEPFPAAITTSTPWPSSCSNSYNLTHYSEGV